MSKEFDERFRPQDDLYHYVNGKTLDELVIPADRPVAGGFSALDINVEKILMDDFKAMAEGEKEIPSKHMEGAVKIYKKVLDVERRNQEGIKPVLPTLERILAIKDIAAFNHDLKELFLDDIPTPINVGVEPDMKDTLHHGFCLVGPSLILPDTTYYENEQGKALLGVYSQMVSMVLAKTPLSEEDQALFLADTLAFDASLAKIEKSQLEWADYIKNYNPFSVGTACKYLGDFDLRGLLHALYGKRIPKKVCALDPKFLKGFKDVFNEKTFEQYKHWAYVKALLGACSLLSEELRNLGGIYGRAMTGVMEMQAVDKFAYRVAGGTFSEPVGIYYGRTYFGEEAKADVVSIVKEIIETYKGRIKENDFLNEATKEKAIRKLETMEIKMGYPDKANKRYDLNKVDDETSLYEAMDKISRIKNEDHFAKLFKDVDRSEWPMPGHMVNACYNPFSNDITFPSAILQEPFYSLKQKREENLGGIGAVIGHEISHAFDNNGAQCDEYGNLNNWWTKEDFREFKKRTKKMIKEFDGIEFAGGKVNGELVVSENIADNGGMAVTLEMMSHIEKADYKAYFINWARVWCQKAKPEYQQLLLSVDVHSPAELRANVQPRNFEEWYKTFKVKKSDKMYISPRSRVGIW